MAASVTPMLRDARTRRTVWLATGATWALSTLLALAQPVPAALAYSAAWLLFAWSIVFVSRLAAARRTHVLGAAIAMAAAITGVANLVVNVLSVQGLADWYLYGILVATVLLVPFSYLFARERLLRLVAFTLGVFLGIGFVRTGARRGDRSRALRRPRAPNRMVRGPLHAARAGARRLIRYRGRGFGPVAVTSRCGTQPSTWWNPALNGPSKTSTEACSESR